MRIFWLPYKFVGAGRINVALKTLCVRICLFLYNYLILRFISDTMCGTFRFQLPSSFAHKKLVLSKRKEGCKQVRLVKLDFYLVN